jgi:dCMP deaminase
MNWNMFYIQMARLVSQKSRDPSTKHGCVLVNSEDHTVLSIGYNGLPRGMEYDEKYLQRPQKLFYFEHAERNAVYGAKCNGVGLIGATAYITGYSCSDCARALIQCGIKHVKIPADSKMVDRWKDSCLAAIEMFQLRGVSLVGVWESGDEIKIELKDVL